MLKNPSNEYEEEGLDINENMEQIDNDTLNNSPLQSKNQIYTDSLKKNSFNKENTLTEKEKLKEDNERLKTDVEILSKKLHDAVSRIGNLENALAKKDNEDNKDDCSKEESTALVKVAPDMMNANTKSLKTIPISNEINIKLDSNENSKEITSPLMYSTTTTTTTTTTTSSIKAGKVFSSSNENVELDPTTNKNIISTIKDLENTIDILNKRLLEEVEKRSELECSHSALVQETEDLTVKLFEEAQSMVATEKRQLFEKNKQVKQLKAIIEEKDNIIKALIEENKTLKQYIQQKIQIPEENRAKILMNKNRTSSISTTTTTTTTTVTNASDNQEGINNTNELEHKETNKMEENITLNSDSNQSISMNEHDSFDLSVKTDLKEDNLKLLLATSPFSPSNGIFNISPDVEDEKAYQTYAFQTLHKQMVFDNKNIFYNEIYNFIKYRHYDFIEHSKFCKRCIIEEIEPCLDFQPINPDFISISAKLNHYNRVRRVVKACKENTLIVQSIYEYPELPKNNNTNDKGQQVPVTNEQKKENVTCSLCFRKDLSLPLYRCFMDDEDKEAQSKAAAAAIASNAIPQYMYACPYCKERMLSVFDFYGCIRYIKTELRSNKSRLQPQESCHKIYGDLLRIRERIYWAKSGLISQDYGLNIGVISC